MNNPYANATILTIAFDQDGEAGSLVYLFGHECSPDDFSGRLQEAAVAWVQSDEAREYAAEQGAYGIDWQDLLNAMSPAFLTAYGIANIGDKVGVLPLQDDLYFDLPEVEDEEEGT